MTLAQWPLLFLVGLYWQRRFRAAEILVCYPDIRFLVAGLCLSKLRRIPYSLYFHNTLSDNMERRPWVRRLEARAVRSAKHVFAISPSLVRILSARYPAVRVSLLPHAMTADAPSSDEIALRPIGRPIRLAFAGSINESCAEAAGRMFEVVRRNLDLELMVYSGMERESLERLGCRGRGITIARVRQEELLDKLRGADVLLHPHGFTGALAPAEYKTIFPTKTVDYLAVGRPILAHLPEEGVLSDFYREHDCALQVHESSVEAIERGLRALTRGDDEIRIRLSRNALRASREFDGTRVADLLRRKLGG
jgi:glycosyltransferase involved in cell wall biosynthesis